MTDKLTDMIDEMVSAKTFSLDALDGVRALKAKAIEQERVIDTLNARIKEGDDRAASLSQRLSVATAEVSKWLAREQDLATRETKVRDLEMSEAKATARATTMTEVFGTLFRNTTVRETNTRSLPFTNTQPGGYTTSGYQPVVESTERTEG